MHAHSRDQRDAAEHGRKAVAGRRRGDADDNAREEPERAFPQALFPGLTRLRVSQPFAPPGVEFAGYSQARRSEVNPTAD